jgi:hypothetical protein
MKWAKFKILQNHLREHFSRSWMSLWKTTFTSHKSSTSVHFKMFKTCSSAFETGSTDFWTVSLPPLLWPVWQSQLSEKSLQIFLWNRFNRNCSRLTRFWIRSSLRLSRSVNRDLPGGNQFNRFVNRFNRFLALFSQRLPAFGGSFKYPPPPPHTHTLCLFITSTLSTISQLTKPQTKAFNSHLTPEITSPSIAWRILGVRWSRSNALSISSWFSHSLCSWAHCKLNLVRICYSWNRNG